MNDYPNGPARTNGKAIAALILGITSLIIPYIGLILGIIAIVFGTQAMRITRETNEAGYGMAVAGMVCGIVAVAIYGLIILLIIIGIGAFAGLYYQ